jgi:pyruvoyl-dependent arginine decarboxylase (PvlArgDC)
MQRIVTLATLCGALLIASCTTGGTSIKSVSRADSIPNAPYGNVLVLTIAKSRSNARQFQNELSAAIATSVTNATPMHVENDSADLSEADVRTVVQKLGADAVVVTSVKQADIGTAVEQSRVEVKQTRKNDTLVDFFRYDYKEVETQEIVRLNYNVTLTTDVYDTATGDKVYTIESITVDAETSFDVILQESAAIAKQLRKGRLIG